MNTDSEFSGDVVVWKVSSEDLLRDMLASMHEIFGVTTTEIEKMRNGKSHMAYICSRRKMLRRIYLVVCVDPQMVERFRKYASDLYCIGAIKGGISEVGIRDLGRDREIAKWLCDYERSNEVTRRLVGV